MPCRKVAPVGVSLIQAMSPTTNLEEFTDFVRTGDHIGPPLRSVDSIVDGADEHRNVSPSMSLLQDQTEQQRSGPA